MGGPDRTAGTWRRSAVSLVVLLLLTAAGCADRKGPVMPDLTGMTARQAAAAFEEAGISVPFHRGTYNKVTVVSTDPASGEMVLEPGDVQLTWTEVHVTKVVDGDTFVISTGDRIRLVGVDTPELGQCGAAKAKTFVTRETRDLPVFVDVPFNREDRRDKHGRLLAYVGTPTLNDLGYQLVAHGLAVPRYNSTDGYSHHPSEETYADGAKKPKSCKPKRPAPDWSSSDQVDEPDWSDSTWPTDESSAGRGLWVCSYLPTYDSDWHNDVLCTDGATSHRPYLRQWDPFVTQSEIMDSAADYERQLNGGS